MTTEQALDVVIQFGKHKGKTLRAIAEEEVLYLDWLDTATLCEPLKSAVKLVCKRHIHEISDEIDNQSLGLEEHDYCFDD